MKNPHKALEAIEILVGSDFGLDMEWLIHSKESVDPRLKDAAKVISEIYLIAHAEGSCTGHPEWEDKKYEIIKQSLT